MTPQPSLITYALLARPFQRELELVVIIGFWMVDHIVAMIAHSHEIGRLFTATNRVVDMVNLHCGPSALSFAHASGSFVYDEPSELIIPIWVFVSVVC